MNISEKKEQLHKLSNELVDSYNSIIEITNNQGLEDKNIIKKLTEQIITQKREIDDKDKQISSQNKKCYDYEVVINEYQDKMVQIEEENKSNNKVSIVISQANELENKDRYIEQLENKIKLIKSKNIGISESPISRSNDVFKKDVELDMSYKENETVDVKSDNGDGTDGTDGDENEGGVVKSEIEDDKSEIEDDKSENGSINSSSEDEDISYKRITYKKIKYFIVIGQDPQIVYKMEESGDPGERVGIRTKKNSKFVITFD
jgi:hypothetical protein